MAERILRSEATNFCDGDIGYMLAGMQWGDRQGVRDVGLLSHFLRNGEPAIQI